MVAIQSENFSHLMKSWRAKSGVSQLELALRCEVSQKHISFLESARSRPSKLMVMLICEALNIPLRDRNSLLLSAGYSPSYRESTLTEPELAAVDQALTMMLNQQEPYPAMVIDRMFNVMRANRGAMQLQFMLYGVDRPEDLPPMAGNLLRGMFHPNGFRRHISNWDELASCVLRRLQSEVYANGGDPELQTLLDEMAECEGVPTGWKQHVPGGWHAPILTVDVEKDGKRLRFFSTIATLGPPQDATLEEIRIESYFPADETTRRAFMDG